MARHFSLGGQEAVGVSPTETPDDPSVPGPDQDESADTPYERAVRTDCFEPERHSMPSVDELREGAGSDSLCGQLVYHEDTNFTQVSDPDQRLHGPIGQFDVVRAYTTGGYHFTHCLTFCTRIPGSTTTWNLLHDVGCQLDRTRCSDEVNDAADRGQRLHPNLLVGEPSTTLEAQTDLWVGNGWTTPAPSESFVAFLSDKDGRPIDDERLREIYDASEAQLPADNAGPKVCGFSPDHSSDSLTLCDIEFQFYSEGDSPADGGEFKTDDNDPCDSPTYVCGATQPHWGTRATCLGSCTWASPMNPYKPYHWVVAPTVSACTGAQEPGFSFDTEATWDYLAHDVDLYVSAAELAPTHDTTGGVWNAFASVAADQQVTEEVSNPSTSALSTVFAPLPPQVDKDHRVEPNAERDAANMTGLGEDSQDPAFTVPREATSECAVLTEEGEPAYAVDPWVNILDMETVRCCSSSFFHPDPMDKGAYGNSADNQDRTNHDTRGSMFTVGYVGLFTDKNDNGAYDRASPSDQFSDIESVGAYPLFWDLWVKDAKQDHEIDTSAGCTLDARSETIPALMKEAGYGPHTGLVQVIYLEEATTFSDFSSSASIPYPSGQNIYVMKSQAIHQLDQDGDSKVRSFLDRIVTGLRSHPKIPDAADVVDVNEAFGIQSAFDPQCQKLTGGYYLDVSFVHNCEVSCEGDTIVTGYMIETTKADNSIGSPGSSGIPVYEPGNEAFEFPQDITTWTDIDPFDNDPKRNDPLLDNERPPHHEPGADPAPDHHEDTQEAFLG